MSEHHMYEWTPRVEGFKFWKNKYIKTTDKNHTDKKLGT